MISPETATDFPIPSDLEGFWSWEKGHYPRPLTPLTQEMVLTATGGGFSKAMEEWGAPAGAETRAINYYGYFTMKPFDLGQETMHQRMARYKDTLARIVPRVGALWEEEWLPSILAGLDKGRSLDYTALNDEQLLYTLDELRQDSNERWYVHGKINF